MPDDPPGACLPTFPRSRRLKGLLILRAFLHFEATSLGRYGFPIVCTYRALPDARMERERWLAVSELVHAFGLEAAL
jgi:hypothetical protein